MSSPLHRYGLPLLVFAQFAGTSLWFVGNAVADVLPGAANLGVGALTSSVQTGFIGGTLVFSLFAVADRVRPNRLFFFSAFVAGLANALLLFTDENSVLVLSIRFLTGFFLAGIYPVGMKLAADLFPEKAGKALGYLVGALVLGTAFPHFVRSQGRIESWRLVVLATSFLSTAGGVVVLGFLPVPKASMKQSGKFRSACHLFRQRPFREAAFGYFGHMWELYALWALLPLMVKAYNEQAEEGFSPSLVSCFVIAAGGIGCAVGGILSQKWGNKPVAFWALMASGVCCLLAPAFFSTPPYLFFLFLLVWGLTVAADSPQFSALVARGASGENRGTALTLLTCIGFSITVISIQLLQTLFVQHRQYALWALAPGPLLGLLALKNPRK